jgi:hypothetical protein
MDYYLIVIINYNNLMDYYLIDYYLMDYYFMDNYFIVII